jgi:CRISPR system Cascade subunit CasD
MTVVLTLRSGCPPTLEETMEALRHPERPLFWGRKACLPARPILDPTTPLVDGPDLLTILRRIPVWDRMGTALKNPGLREACWPSSLDCPASEVQRVYDLRHWRNQLFAGSRERRQGMIGGLEQ